MCAGLGGGGWGGVAQLGIEPASILRLAFGSDADAELPVPLFPCFTRAKSAEYCHAAVSCSVFNSVQGQRLACFD